MLNMYIYIYTHTYKSIVKNNHNCCQCSSLSASFDTRLLPLVLLQTLQKVRHMPKIPSGLLRVPSWMCVPAGYLQRAFHAGLGHSRWARTRPNPISITIEDPLTITSAAALHRAPLPRSIWASLLPCAAQVRNARHLCLHGQCTAATTSAEAASFRLLCSLMSMLLVVDDLSITSR